MEIILGEYGDPRSGGGSSSNRPMPVAAAPSSDAAQPEARERIEADQEALYGFPGQCDQCGGETFVVEITRCRGCKQEFYTRDQSLTASRLAHPEDAPEGPWKIISTMEPDAFVVRKSGVKCGRGPFTWAEVVAVCDRLNRLHRRTGDKK